MIALRDRTGRLWTAKLTLDVAREWKSLAGLDVFGDDALTLGVAVNALWLLCVPPAERGAVSDVRFGLLFRRRWRRGWHVHPDLILQTVHDEISEFLTIPGPARDPGNGRPLTSAEQWRDTERMAGVVAGSGGLNWGELFVQHEGVRRHDWEQTAFTNYFIAAGNGSKEPVEKFDHSGVIAEMQKSGGEQMEVTADSLSVVARIFGGFGRN